MSDHIRKQIRKSAIAALQGLATTGSRVYESRVYPLAQAQLPGLCVFTPLEASGREDSPTESMRDMTLMVHGVVAISDKLEDELDDIALEVEIALDELADLDGLAKIYHGIQGTVTTLSGEEAEKPYGAIDLEFLYTYRTRSGTPDIAR
ncbi:hypothetical protein LCGC14_1593230 [marine sediment metagenome]|uniref:Uncharacterized protein n=1 Tax=marine sediment metagenome TaxID=412755 RepID=A0A0F9IDC5_9ZZZZ